MLRNVVCEQFIVEEKSDPAQNALLENGEDPKHSCCKFANFDFLAFCCRLTLHQSMKPTFCWQMF